MKHQDKNDLQLLATKLTKKLTKKYHKLFPKIQKQTTKKNYKKSKFFDLKSVTRKHCKTSCNLSKTIKMFPK